MATEIKELEGTWEEIMKHAEELAGKRVRVVVFETEAETMGNAPEGSAAAALMPFVRGWEGDDLEELTRDVYENRSQTRF
ncbi:MAG TPA: hypothetical protein VND68_06410 [Chloroflexia bacterium]|nr:hypothetical protein [Chloroflexia bacterium]